MPNITGTFNSTLNSSRNKGTSGAFYSDNKQVGLVEAGQGYNGCYSFFDASRSSSIYGSSDIVTPLSESVMFCIAY